MSKIYSIGDEEELVADMPNIINERIKAELEEIKAEIRQGVSDFANENGDIAYGFMCAEKIIDNHINKADCNNDCEHCEWTECPKE